MRIGIPIWNGRVSPVLDTAERIVVLDAGAAGGQAREEVALEQQRLPLRAARIAELHLDLLVCGAVSRPLAEMLAAAGVPTEPWVAGELDDVIDALSNGRLDAPRYRMPGCCRRGSRGRGRHNQRGRSGAPGRNR